MGAMLRSSNQITPVEMTEDDFDRDSDEEVTYKMQMETEDAIEVMRSLGSAGVLTMDDLE